MSASSFQSSASVDLNDFCLCCCCWSSYFFYLLFELVVMMDVVVMDLLNCCRSLQHLFVLVVVVVNDERRCFACVIFSNDLFFQCCPLAPRTSLTLPLPLCLPLLFIMVAKNDNIMIEIQTC